MKRIFLFLLFSVLISGTCAVAAVQENTGRAQPETEKHEESPWGNVFRWANVVVLFGGLGYLLRKPAGQFFKDRRNQITSGLDRAHDAQVGAQARMDDIERRLANLSAEIKAMQTEAAGEAAAERNKILEEAKREVDRVVEQSRQEIERVSRGLEREIKQNVADLVIDRAGTTLRTEMTEDDQKRVIVRFIKKL